MSENAPNKKEPDANSENDKSKPFVPIPAYRDTFVHFLFGSPGNESILLNFLNAVLESDGQPPAKSVVAKNPFNPQTFVTDKYTILDVKATDERGDIFAVEFQTSERATFADRLTYYGSRTFGGQMYKGDPYSVLRAVIAIAVTTFEMFPQLESIHNSFYLTAKADPKIIFTRLLQMHTLEVTKEKIDRVVLLPSILAAWVIFIFYSHLKTEDEMTMLLKDQPELIKAYEQYQLFNHDERLRALDEAHQRFLHDLATDIEEAHEKGVAEGEAKEREKGCDELIETLLRILSKNFDEVPSSIHDKLYIVNDLKTLGQLTRVALDCQSLTEFEVALGK